MSAGGYVAPDGALTLTAKGGNVTLYEPTAYFPFAFAAADRDGDLINYPGAVAGFRVNGNPLRRRPPVNPATINAKVAIGPNVIQASGFTGGAFSLTTPAFSLGDGVAATGTQLPLDFFTKAGFATYNITSYATDLTPNTSPTAWAAINAVLATQVLTCRRARRST